MAARRVIVVGGGIAGAAAAWHLVRSGAAVTLFRDGRPGATAASYGWLGTLATEPPLPAVIARRLEALAEYTRLASDLGPLPVAARGTIAWGENDDATAARIDALRAAGVRIESLSRRAVLARVPRLAAPALAAWAPDEMAVESGRLAAQLMAAATAAGATLIDGRVEAVLTASGRTTGVRADGRDVTADQVLLANGVGGVTLARSAGVTLRVNASPAMLLRFDAPPDRLRHLVYAGELEVRPGLDGGLVSAADVPPGGTAGVAAMAADYARAIADLLRLPSPPVCRSAVTAERPMPVDGPICGALEGCAGLFGLVAHPGVLLAPLLGREVAAAIAGD